MRPALLLPWAVLLIIITAGAMLWRQTLVVSERDAQWQQSYAAQAAQTRRANNLVATANDRIRHANAVIQERNHRLGRQDATLGHLAHRAAAGDKIIAAQRAALNRLSTPAATYTPPPTYTPYPTATPRPTYTPPPPLPLQPTYTPPPTYTPHPTPTPAAIGNPPPVPTAAPPPTRRPTATPWPTATPLPAEKVSIYEGIKVYSHDGSGRGFITSAGCRDYFITAAHVVENSRRVYIEYPFGRNVGWKPVTARHPDQDIAIVEISNEFIGDCGDGYWPDSLGHILSQGAITAYRSDYTTRGDCPLVRTDVMITDAPAYPGYSGSPVLNADDYLIGITVCGDAHRSVVVAWDVIEDLLP